MPKSSKQPKQGKQQKPKEEDEEMIVEADGTVRRCGYPAERDRAPPEYTEMMLASIRNNPDVETYVVRGEGGLLYPMTRNI